MVNDQKKMFESMANNIIGRVYLKDGLKSAMGDDRFDIANQYGITDIWSSSDGYYTGTFKGMPILIETEDFAEKDSTGHTWVTVAVTNVRRIDTEGVKDKPLADLGMGNDSANTMYLLGDKKVNAAHPFSRTREAIDRTIYDRLNAPQTEEGDTWKELKDRAKNINLSDRSAKNLASVYDTLDAKGKNAINKYLQYLKFNITSQVSTLLGQMIKAVPLETYQDFKDVGFYSKAGQGGNSDDLFAIKAACGLKQAGKDPNELFNSGQFKQRKEIEQIVSQVISEKNKTENIDPKKQQMIDALVKMGWDKDKSTAAVNNTYKVGLSDTDNIRNALGYKPKAQARLLRYADKASLDKFFKEHGIVPQKADPSHSVCSIGFSEKEQKWYGWSHRAIYGFGIGHEVKKGDCGADGWAEGQKGIKPGFICKTKDDCEKVARAFAESVS